MPTHEIKELNCELLKTGGYAAGFERFCTFSILRAEFATVIVTRSINNAHFIILPNSSPGAKEIIKMRYIQHPTSEFMQLPYIFLRFLSFVILVENIELFY